MYAQHHPSCHARWISGKGENRHRFTVNCCVLYWIHAPIESFQFAVTTPIQRDLSTAFTREMATSIPVLFAWSSTTAVQDGEKKVHPHKSNKTLAIDYCCAQLLLEKTNRAIADGYCGHVTRLYYVTFFYFYFLLLDYKYIRGSVYTFDNAVSCHFRVLYFSSCQTNCHRLPYLLSIINKQLHATTDNNTQLNCWKEFLENWPAYLDDWIFDIK